MGLLVAALGFGLAAMVVSESLTAEWRKSVGGLILIAALLVGIGSDY